MFRKGLLGVVLFVALLSLLALFVHANPSKAQNSQGVEAKSGLATAEEASAVRKCNGGKGSCLRKTKCPASKFFITSKGCSGVTRCCTPKPLIGQKCTSSSKTGVCRKASACSTDENLAVAKRCAGTAVCCIAKAPVPPTVPPTSGSIRTVLAANFNTMTVGAVDPTQFKGQLGGTYGKHDHYKTMQVIDLGSGNRAIRVNVAATTVGPSGAVTLFLGLPELLEEACITYDVRFSGTFDFDMGGKLPGLSGIAAELRDNNDLKASLPSSGNAFDPVTYKGWGGVEKTCERRILGWSGRVMWLGRDTATGKTTYPQVTNYMNQGHKNMGVSYMYHYTQTSKYGSNMWWNTEFKAGTWHTIKHCYKLNSVTGWTKGQVKGTGNPDGVLQAWVDGKQVLNDHKFVYRVRNDVTIGDIMFAVFRGGDQPEWGATTHGAIDFDNFKITTTQPKA